MRSVRPIPRSVLSDTVHIREMLPDGSFGEVKLIENVRYERTQSVSTDAHRSADAGHGKVFIDAVNSSGAYEVPCGSRVEIGGQSYLVAEVKRCEDFNGHVHHWELVVR